MNIRRTILKYIQKIRKGAKDEHNQHVIITEPKNPKTIQSKHSGGGGGHNRRIKLKERNYPRWAWKRAFKGIACPQPF